MLEFTGTLYRIDEIASHELAKGGVFSNRTFLMKYLDPENREQVVKFNIEPPMQLNLIEDFQIGQELTVKFYLCGRESVSKYNGGMNLFERKRVTSIEPASKKKGSDSQKNQQMRIHIETYVGPDLTQDFSMFPDTIDF